MPPSVPVVGSSLLLLLLVLQSGARRIAPEREAHPSREARRYGRLRTTAMRLLPVRVLLLVVLMVLLLRMVSVGRSVPMPWSRTGSRGMLTRMVLWT